MGFTYAEHNPDSWEGWHWGAMHMWGNSLRLGINEQYGLLEDALKHTDMVVYWSADPEASCNGVYGAMEGTVRRRWLKELGVKSVVIDPYFNHTGGPAGRQVDSATAGHRRALGLAIAFTWLTEDTTTRSTSPAGRPASTSGRSTCSARATACRRLRSGRSGSGIPAREIRALAREWAAKKTMLAAGGPGGMGGACRAATGNEWARTMVALAAMQGLGKPGSNIWGTTSGAPLDCSFMFPGYAEGGISGRRGQLGRRLPLRQPHVPARRGARQSAAIHRGPDRAPPAHPRGHASRALEWRGKGFCGSHIESQFQKYKYPGAGLSPMGMYYRYGGSFIGTMTETNRYVRAYRRERCPFVVNQAIWFEGETKFADIILPACTNFERWDISEFANCSGYIADSYQLQPPGDQAAAEMHRAAGRVQVRLRHLRRARPSDWASTSSTAWAARRDLDWVKDYFQATDLPKDISWEEFSKKGYFVVPAPRGEALRPRPALVRRGADEGHARLGPASRDQSAARACRPPAVRSSSYRPVSSAWKPPARGPGAAGHAPSTSPVGRGTTPTELYDKYPLQLISPHPVQLPHHGRCQGQLDERRERPPRPRSTELLLDHARQHGGRRRARHQRDDLVRAFNDRGAVILAAQVTERVPPGTVHSYESSRRL